ncbi:MAG TPA: polyprenyl synthetase family protein [Anaerolineae bacterium]|nr:polyprenyl synthetase family protein [Anaerolineae bacterium]
MTLNLKPTLTQLDQQLHQFLHTDITPLQEAGRLIITEHDQRIRSQLTLLAFLAAGGDQHQFPQITPLAASIELVHTANLIHDDINNYSQRQRDKIDVRNRWGSTFALLCGDYFFAKVYQIMAPYSARHNEIIATACVRLVEGETLQSHAAKEGFLDEPTYNKIIDRKTARLFQAAALLPAISATDDETIIAALGQFGLHLGLTYQIIQDIIDLHHNLAEQNQNPAHLLVAQAVSQPTHHSVPPATPTKISPATNALQHARQHAHQTAHHARQALAPLPHSPAHDDLIALLDSLLDTLP